MPSSEPDTPLAILELNDIVVTVGNAAKEDDKHNGLPGYEYDGQTEDNEVVCRAPCWVYVDGVGPVVETFVEPRDIMKRIEQREKNKPITAGEMEMTGQVLKGGYIRPFCFSLRQTVETESATPSENIKQFGEIGVEVFWAVWLPLVKKELGEDWDVEDVEILSKPVDEKLKHIQHRFVASLGEPEADEDAASRTELDTEWVNEDEVFWFSFQYRDIEWLKAEGIVPKHI
ncbi:hypothetical protein FRC10_007567 [Ceratobasidium sp. 414]|nr:hypothetical protein FRC10_007567 [Ceratobasidium sp. 414]